jgi:5-methylthioribose kinase
MVNWLVDQGFVIWRVFASHFEKLWSGASESAMLRPGFVSETELNDYKDRFMQRLLQETVGFAACSIARRTLGIAGVADIREIDDPRIRSTLEIINLELSMLLMARHNSVANIDDVIELVSDFYRPQTNI